MGNKQNRTTVRNNPIYTVFMGMKQRCLNPNQPSYKDYGGRNITICDKWMKYKGFAEDMLDTFEVGLTLDRIDGNGNYCKENCRWATIKIQNNNTRRNRYVEYQGMVKTLSQWGEFFNIKSSTLRQRYYVYKWSLDNCFKNKKEVNIGNSN